MAALISRPLLQNNTYHTPYSSPNENLDTCVEIPPTDALQSHCLGPRHLFNAEPWTDEHPNFSNPSEDVDNGPDAAALATPPARKRKTRSITTSPYFPTSASKNTKHSASPYFPKLPKIKPKPSDRLSCIPFPPLSSPSFGLVQERLAHNPFRLLLATIFLNKTRGALALPALYNLLARHPTPAHLAAANPHDITPLIAHLGLQNQRATKCINLATAWLRRPPERGKRYRVLHYPNPRDGSDVRADEILAETDHRVGWEIGQLPGVGAYAIDSWRIFCRDDLRGLPSELPAASMSILDAEQEEMQREWTRVLPLDKELRAYLRWRWLRIGWEWDPGSGERVRACETRMASVGRGGVVCEEGGSSVVVVDGGGGDGGD